jgi:hypothetical protein
MEFIFLQKQPSILVGLQSIHEYDVVAWRLEPLQLLSLRLRGIDSRTMVSKFRCACFKLELSSSSAHALRWTWSDLWIASHCLVSSLWYRVTRMCPPQRGGNYWNLVPLHTMGFSSESRSPPLLSTIHRQEDQEKFVQRMDWVLHTCSGSHRFTSRNSLKVPTATRALVKRHMTTVLHILFYCLDTNHDPSPFCWTCQWKNLYQTRGVIMAAHYNARLFCLTVCSMPA